MNLAHRPVTLRLRALALSALMACMAGTSMSALAGAFEVGISPSRFEISGKSGQRVGQSLDLYNLGPTAAELSIRTLDWGFSPQGQVSYLDELAPGSCRPWVTLERRTVRLPAHGKMNFRFQVQIPEGTARVECRFMLAVEGVEPAHKALVENGGANLSLPVNGRIAVAVYMAVNGAAPKLVLSQIEARDVGGKKLPTVTVNNQGDAHGRLDGALDAQDVNGKRFEFVPEGSPILPGQTRTLTLQPRVENEGNAPTPQFSYPLSLEGTLDWDRGAFKIKATLP